MNPSDNVLSSSIHPPAIVLDTNIVLDWLVFSNPELVALQTAVVEGHVRWLVTPAMRRELGFVLEGTRLGRWKPDKAALWSTWDRHGIEAPVPPPGDPTRRPRCTDIDDQMFIDLAIVESARWLVTRDRAVLKLARRLRPFGVEVVTPKAWTFDTGSKLPPP
jgi:uncharacterized protein